MKKRLLDGIGWVLLAATIHHYLFHSGYPSYGQDFFYYRSLAALSRTVPPERMYDSREKLLAIEAEAAAARLRAAGSPVDAAWVLREFPKLTDPRFPDSPLPLFIYPQWASIREFSRADYSKVSPATYGLFRVLGLDLISFESGFRIWNFVSVALVLSGLFHIRRWIRLEVPYSWFALAAFWFDPVRSSLIYGQFMELIFFLIARSLAMESRSPHTAVFAGALLGISIVIKPLALGMVILIVWEAIFIARRRTAAFRRLLGCAAGAFLTVAAFEIILGWGVFLEWLRRFGDWYLTYTYTLTSVANRSAPAAVISWFRLHPLAPAVQIAARLHAVLILVIYVWHFLAAPNREALAAKPSVAAAMALIGPIAVSRFLLIQYELLLLIPLALLAAEALRTGNRAGLMLVAVFHFGFGFYEKFPVLLRAHPEFFLYPFLLLSLGAVARSSHSLTSSPERVNPTSAS